MDKINKIDETNKNKYHYCTGPLDKFKIYLVPDKIFGVYIGCCCKKHDILYATDHQMFDKEPHMAHMKRSDADKFIKYCILTSFIKKGCVKTGFLISNLYYIFSKLFGSIFFKKWSLRGVDKYKII